MLHMTKRKIKTVNVKVPETLVLMCQSIAELRQISVEQVINDAIIVDLQAHERLSGFATNTATGSWFMGALPPLELPDVSGADD